MFTALGVCMPRIKSLEKWIFRKIKKIGDFAEFKIIDSDSYRNRKWRYAKTVHISVYRRGEAKRVGVLILDLLSDTVEFKEFLTLVGAINYITSWYPPNIYTYYYTKPK